ncbi:MAG: FdhF/YdeP family oxidoreductase [Crocinitomicaceae bacterium]
MPIKRNLHILPPEEFSELTRGKRKKKAAGVPALISTFQHISKEMGVWKGIKLLNKMNQKDGFDCPGCAWPDPDGKRSGLGEYCENGAKAIAEEATDKRVTPEFFEKHSVEELSGWSDYQLGKSGRLTQPMYLSADAIHYKPISWEAAFKKIAEKLKSLNDPNEAVFYTSGRTSNEAAYLYQLMVRQYGTNNLPDCSNMCHESSGVALGQTLGIGKGSVTLEDFYEAEVVMIVGQNPGTNHPRMLSALEKCKKNGGKIVSINPIPEAGNNVFVNPQNPFAIFKGGIDLEDHYLQVKINGDVALLKALMLLLLEAEDKAPGSVFDLDFINQYTDGFDLLMKELRSTHFGEMVRQSGVPESKIREVANLLIEKKKIIICWAMGITQHENGVDNIKEMVNLLLLKGSIGKKGAGTCPVRGHSNVQGDRTMGIWEKPKEEFLASLRKHFDIEVPSEHGVDAVESIAACEKDKVRFFMFLGGNFISATPDSQRTGEAIQNCDLTVQISTKLNRSHVVTGKEAIILPCLARSDKDQQKSGLQFVSVENSMGIVHSSKGSLPPFSDQLKSEPAIIAGIAHAVFGSEKINWAEMTENYDTIRDHIEATIPGFDEYNKRVRIPRGFYLPNGSRDRNFATPNGKAQFSVVSVPDRKIDHDSMIMMTIRTHDQYNTTIYGMDDRYRGIKGERRVVLMNPEDMESKKLKEEEVVDIVGLYEGKERIARNFKVLPYDIAMGCVATYFPEANVLVPLESVAKGSNTPVSKFIEVKLRKV